MKTLILFILGILTYRNSFEQNLKIELTNKTGFDIDSVALCSKYVGLLKKDSSVTIQCDEIIMQDESIMGFPNGNIKDKKRLPLIWECATGSKTINRGNYSFNIFISENGNKYQLYYSKKY